MATEEYVTNGTAEDGTTTGWATSGTVGSSTTTAYAGSRSFSIKTTFGFGSPSDSLMSQAITTVPGTSYTISFAYNGLNADPIDSDNSNDLIFGVQYDPAAGFTQELIVQAPFAPITWQTHTAVIVATHTTTTIRFNTEATEVDSELSSLFWYVDAISLLGPVITISYISLPENTEPPHCGLSAEDDMSGTLVPEERLIRLPDGRLIDRDERDQPGRDDWLEVYPIRTEQPRSDP